MPTGQFSISNSPNVHVYELWKETVAGQTNSTKKGPPAALARNSLITLYLKRMTNNWTPQDYINNILLLKPTQTLTVLHSLENTYWVSKYMINCTKRAQTKKKKKVKLLETK